MRTNERLIIACVSAYADGLFPMADPDTLELEWYRAKRPAIVPLDSKFHIPKSLKRVINSGAFSTCWDNAFNEVVEGCANRNPTWISPQLKDIYRDLHDLGYAHSFEAWKGDQLAGGVLCISIGTALIGESMFTAIDHGSKVALVQLVKECHKLGITHFDCQILNEHTARFGAYELTPEIHQALLFKAVSAKLSQNPFLSHSHLPNPQISATTHQKSHAVNAPVVA